MILAAKHFNERRTKMKRIDWEWVKQGWGSTYDDDVDDKYLIFAIGATIIIWLTAAVILKATLDLMSLLVLLILSAIAGLICGIPLLGIYWILRGQFSVAGEVSQAIKEDGLRILPGPLKTIWFALLLFPGVIGHLPYLLWWLAKMVFSPQNWARVAAGMTGVIRNWRQKQRDPRLRALTAQEDRLRKELKAVRRGADGELTARIERNLSQIRGLRTQILAEAESERRERIRLHHENKIEAAEAVIDEIRQLIEAEVVERQEDSERLAAAYDEAEAAANRKALEELFQKQSS